MKALSIIEIPVYQKKKFKKKVLWVSIDYKRFNIKDNDIIENSIFFLHRAPNDTNSNIKYDWNVSYIRCHSPRWVAHQIIVSMENIWPVPIAYAELYRKGQGLKWSLWRVDFYGAFFHFFKDLPDRYIIAYNSLMSKSIISDKVRVTRIDVAIDLQIPFPQNWWNWIRPCKNSNREVVSYRHEWKFNSYWYLADKNSWYWVRMYNKFVNVDKLWKHKWYWWFDKMPEDWTRIEFEFYPPYSVMEEWELMQICKEKIVWNIQVNLWLPFRPNFDFDIENAYNYFLKYAKNHWIEMETLLDELVSHHIYLQKFFWQDEEIL